MWWNCSMNRMVKAGILVMIASLAFAQTPTGGSAWIPLFNGTNLDGWMWSTDADPGQPCWAAEDGMLRTTPGKGKPTYLLTRDSFSDFEMSLEWKTEPGANSGVKYRFQGYWVEDGGKNQLRADPAGPGRIEPVAFEYQIIDDQRHPDALGSEKHSTAALYEYWPAHKDGPAKADIWHTSRIVARGLHIEHWLDGKKVLNVKIDSPELQESFRQSPRRGSSPVLAKQERRDSPIALQFHDGVVWFRNIKIRRL
jgi:hypothetical protein